MSLGGRRLAPVIKLLESCNLACSYCYQEDLLGPRRVMSGETLERILSELARVRTAPLQILWFGGEPTLIGRRAFARAIERAEAHLGAGGLRHAIQTNATRIDDAWAQLLAEHRFSVTVSLDGFEELHDAHRRTPSGRGSHATVVAGIRALQRAGIAPRASCVLTAAALPHAERLVDYFAALGVSEADFPPAGRVVNGRYELGVDPVEYGRFMSRVLDRWLAIGQGGFRIRSLAGVARAMSGLPPAFCKFEASCAQYVTFGYDGRVYPCDEFAGQADHELGSILREPLDTIIDSPRARDIHEAWTAPPAACGGCEWLDICRGGCPFERRLNGGVDQKTILCEGLKIVYAHMAREVRPNPPAATLASRSPEPALT